jgi:hypothetical protein
MKKYLSSAKILFLLLLILYIPNKTKCQDIKTDNNDDYKEVVLDIPPVIITRYEYKKNLNELINNYKNTNKAEPSEEILNNWRKEFLEKMYLLAGLKDEGFDKRQDVLNTVNSMERVIITQEHGLVYDEFVTKEVNVSEEAVKAAYEKSGKHIKVEYLKFPDKSYLTSMSSISKTNGKIETKDDFNTLASACKGHSQIKYGTVEFVWPYFGIKNIAEKMYNLEKDEIIQPTEMADGIYVYCAKEVYYAEKLPYEKISPRIKMILEENEKTVLRNTFYSKVDAAVFSHVDEAACDKFINKYDIELFKDYNESRRAEKLNMQFKDILEDTMLIFSINSVNSILTVEGFLNHYSHMLMLPIFTNQSDLSNYLLGYVREEYLLQLADSLGIKQSIKFQLDKTNYKNKTILGFFEARDLLPNIQVSGDEIEIYYGEHQQDYLSGETAKISVYTFDSERNAKIGRMGLMRGMKNTPPESEGKPQYEGLKQLDSNVVVTRNDGKYSKEIIRVIFNLKDDQISSPLKSSGDFIVIKKIKETGSTVKPIEEVRDDIIQSIKKMKCDKIKNEKILLAKKRYQIKVNKIVTE